MITGTQAHLRHVGIRTHDIARTADFYTKIFRLRPIKADPKGEWAVIGDGVLNVTIVPVLCGPDTASPIVEGGEPIHLGFIVPDLLETFGRCQQWGATILAGDVSTREPLPVGELPKQSFKVADPNGNVIDVVADPNHWAGVTL